MHTATHTCAIIQMSAINLRCKTARNQKRSKLKMSAVKKGYTNTHSTFLAQSSCHPLPTLHHVSKDNLALICSILVLMQFSGNIHLGRLFILQNNLLYIDADTLRQILEICQLLSPIAPKYGDLNNNSGLIHLSFFDSFRNHLYWYNNLLTKSVVEFCESDDNGKQKLNQKEKQAVRSPHTGIQGQLNTCKRPMVYSCCKHRTQFTEQLLIQL